MLGDVRSREAPMVDNDSAEVPVWTLTTRETSALPISVGDRMTPERLAELRTALAAFAEAPIATLEAHVMPSNIDRRRGMKLEAASPLATQLGLLLQQTSKGSAAVPASATGETLYRMVVPARVAGQFGSGMLQSMRSGAAPGAIYSALRGSTGIAAQASFVPVAGATAASSAAAGSAATAGIAVAGAGALTVAAPLVLMAVAVGVSAYAEHKRQEAVENITVLLESLKDEALDRERSALNGCRAAVDKATAVLLDRGRIGAALGLDGAVHAIEVALADAELRLAKWKQGLEELRNGKVETDVVEKWFEGFDADAGEFRAHLELAALAIALKKRVIALQAVEHAQAEPENLFESFMRALRQDQQHVVSLERELAQLLIDLSQLRLDRPHGFRNVVFTPAEVDRLLNASYRLRELGDGVQLATEASDVAIDIVRSRDGSVIVFPAAAA